MPRFNGKELVMKPVVDGINHPKELIEDILENKAPIYHADSSASSSDNDAKRKTRFVGIYLQELNEWY